MSQKHFTDSERSFEASVDEGMLGDEYELSKLYDKHFTTEFRKGTDQ